MRASNKKAIVSINDKVWQEQILKSPEVIKAAEEAAEKLRAEAQGAYPDTRWEMNSRRLSKRAVVDVFTKDKGTQFQEAKYGRIARIVSQNGGTLRKGGRK